jgi:DNA-binding YbaB/EbfC family protein
MFREIGQFAGLMGKLPRIKEEMEKLQRRLAEITAEGQAGGGMVTVKVNGQFAMVGCKLSDEAINLHDRELLEDLILAATNQAIDRARQMVASETSKMAADLGLPPGLNLPGLT